MTPIFFNPYWTNNKSDVHLFIYELSFFIIKLRRKVRWDTVGGIVACGILSELDDLRCFSTIKHLVGNLGLAPGMY